MKLWEVKGQALKLMFADSDMSYNENDFIEGTLESNGNTRDKLLRMNDSINRAIDLYYQYCGHITRRKEVKFIDFIETTLNTSGIDAPPYYYKEEDVEVEDEATALDEVLGEYNGKLNLEEISDLGTPLRLLCEYKLIAFYWDTVSGEMFVDEEGFISPYSNYTFTLHYQALKQVVPFNASDIDFDFNDIYIPEDVQRMIPMYIKGELYEEDESDLAVNSKNLYIQYLMSRGRNTNKKVNKVKSTFIRG